MAPKQPKSPAATTKSTVYRRLTDDPAELLEAARHADEVVVTDENGRPYVRVTTQREPLTFE